MFSCYAHAIPGFQWKAREQLHRAKKKGVCVFGTNMLPYNCRTTEWGRAVRLFGEKITGVSTLSTMHADGGS